jgi:hypothetical protein
MLNGRMDTGGTKSTASVLRSLLPASETREQAWYRSATDKRSAARRASGSLSRSYYRWFREHPGLGRWGTEVQGTHCREGEAGHNGIWRELRERHRAHKPYHRNSGELRITDGNSYAPNGRRHLFGSSWAKAFDD